MIKIKKTIGADTRSCAGEISKKQLFDSTEQHIDDVRKAMLWMIMELFSSSTKHDYTKIKKFDEFYTDFIESIKNKSNFKNTEWYKMHITTERHHIDKIVLDDINLFDVLEHIADIVTAGLSRTGNFYDEKLDPEILKKAYENTINKLMKNIELTD